MSNNLTLGPVQIYTADVPSINLALAEIQNRIDELKGLRGRTELWDRTQTGAPVVLSDAVDLGSLDQRESLYHLTFLGGSGAGLVALQPGTSYVELGSLLRQQVNFSAPAGLQGRMVVGGWGTESGSDKGVAMTDDTGTTLVEVEWDGNDEDVMIGDFTALTVSTDTLVRLAVKGSSATESLILKTVGVEFRFEVGSSLTS